MKIWTRPIYSRERVNAAGEVLIDPAATEPEKNFALSVIGNWRSSHAYPLHALKMTLRSRSKKIDSTALVAQRLKRLSSIAAKLSRREGMLLARMQDIGGCRAVLKNVRHVDKVARLYTKSRAKNPQTRAEFVKAYDYVKNPKPDGYRSIHLVYKYRSGSELHKCWNGLRLEIQLRTRLQHAWATAVETVDSFTRAGLKTGDVPDSETFGWGRFFALASSYVAYREDRPLVPNTPEDLPSLISLLRESSILMSVEPRLRGWMTAMQHLESQEVSQLETIKTAVMFLLTTDAAARRVSFVAYPVEKIAEAQDEYLRREKAAEDTPGVQSVLVSVDSMDAIREAYPNYFADTTEFLAVLDEAVR